MEFKVGDWVQITYKKPSKEEIKRAFTGDRAPNSWPYILGNVFYISSYDKTFNLYFIKQKTGHSYWMSAKWMYPIKEEEISRLLRQRKDILEGRKQLKAAKEKEEELLKELFAK